MENCLVGNQDFVAYPHLISFSLCQISLNLRKLLLYNTERKQEFAWFGGFLKFVIIMILHIIIIY